MGWDGYLLTQYSATQCKKKKRERKRITYINFFSTTCPDIYHYYLLAFYRDMSSFRTVKELPLRSWIMINTFSSPSRISRIQTSVWTQNAFLPPFSKKENHGAFPYLSNLITFLLFYFLFFFFKLKKIVES